ncbi:MAG: hypothetical protein MUC88_07010 [Planctomycetes bacterium]|nr:hypothetical protein [Planctomycetota bacterium]
MMAAKLGWLVLPAILLGGSANPSERTKTIHVFVALCDNEHQGIVPVPKELGQGDDPGHNLYWGALYGVRTFLGKSKDWTLVATRKNVNDRVLERIVFRHRTTHAYLVADAYRGDKIRDAVSEFLGAAAGNGARMLTLEKEKAPLGIHGGADLVVYVGHNGLMDFQVEAPAPERDARPRSVMVLACTSRPYFQPH